MAKYYTVEMMRGYDELRFLKSKLFKELQLFFGEVTPKELNNYLQHKMKEINEQIPLNKK